MKDVPEKVIIDVALSPSKQDPYFLTLVRERKAFGLHPHGKR
jgi:hypothetical protein